MKEINRKSMNKSYIDIMRGLREDNDKTQQDIADFLGISQSYISRLEKKIMLRLRREIVRYQ